MRNAIVRGLSCCALAGGLLTTILGFAEPAAVAAETQMYSIQSLGHVSDWADPMFVGNDGTIVFNDRRGSRVAVLKNGIFQELPLGESPDGIRSANGANAAGAVVGGSHKYVDGTLVGYHGFVWQDGIMHDMGTLGVSADGWFESNAYAINDSGLVIGSSTKYVDGEYKGTRAVTWQNGVLTELPVLAPSPEGWAESRAVELTNSGLIGGFSNKWIDGRDLGPRPVIWHNGQVTELPVLGVNASGEGYGCVADINSAGYATGESSLPIGDGLQRTTAVVWRDGQIYDLGAPEVSGGDISGSTGWTINEAGDVIGYSWTVINGMLDYRGVLWKDGHAYELERLGAGTPGEASFSGLLSQLNANGDVIGNTAKYDADGNYVRSLAAFMRDGRTYFIDPGVSSSAAVLTDDGQVFGAYEKEHIFGPDSYAGWYAMVWTVEGGMVDLNTLVEGGITAAGWDHLASVMRVNDLGQLIGYGVNLDGEREFFVMTPTDVPEPSSLALVTVTALAMLRRRGR